MADSHWDKLTTDFSSGMWGYTFCQLPFLEAKFKRFVEERGGAPWKVLDVGCGMGASYVLAFDLSKNMVEGAKMATDKFLQSQARPASSKVDDVEASATNCSAIPGAQEGTFDLAVCVYIMCHLKSKEEVKQTLAEIYKMLKPGGRLIIYENHVLKYMEWDDKPNIPFLNRLG